MKKLSFISLAVACFWVQSVGAEVIYPKDGHPVEGTGLQRTGDNISATVQMGSGATANISFAVTNIVRIDFPPNPVFDKVADLLAHGQDADALTALTPVLAAQEGFKSIPGNYWSQAAMIKTRILMKMDRVKDAQPILQDVVTQAPDSEAGILAKLRLAKIAAATGDPSAALDIYEEVLKKAVSTSTLAEAWVDKGDALSAQKNYESALKAYLRVPVFYPDETSYMPQVLLGTGLSLISMGNPDQAAGYLKDLVTKYPSSPEAAIAKDKLNAINSSPSS